MLGETLRNKREEAGLDLREVAHTLRFQYDYLKALEDEDLERLPPDVYVKAYLKGYAKLLNIDPLPLLDDYAELSGKTSVEVPVEPPRPQKKLLVRRTGVFVSLIVVICLTLLVFLYPKKPVTRVVSPAPAPAESVPVPGPLEHVLDVAATETTWLLIETEEGISEEVLLRPGETRRWTSEGGFDLKVGNAGGIRLAFDNKDMGTPGDKGRVVRLHLP